MTTREAEAPSDDLIAEAIEDQFGERSPDFHQDCSTCQAWAQYDALRASEQSLSDLSARYEAVCRERDEARTMAALSPETQTGAALHRAEAALATLREKVRVLGEFAEATTEPNMVGVPAMVLTEALAALLAPSGNGEGT